MVWYCSNQLWWGGLNVYFSMIIIWPTVIDKTFHIRIRRELFCDAWKTTRVRRCNSDQKTKFSLCFCSHLLNHATTVVIFSALLEKIVFYLFTKESLRNMRRWKSTVQNAESIVPVIRITPHWIKWINKQMLVGKFGSFYVKHLEFISQTYTSFLKYNFLWKNYWIR